MAGVLRRALGLRRAAARGPADGERHRRRLRVLGADRLLGRPAARRSRDHPDGRRAGRRLLLRGAWGCTASRSPSAPRTPTSLRVVAKLGFRPEGLRPRYLHIDGDWRDHLVFALNAEEVPRGPAAALGEPPRSGDSSKIIADVPVRAHRVAQSLAVQSCLQRSVTQFHATHRSRSPDGADGHIPFGRGDDGCDLRRDRDRVAGVSGPALRAPPRRRRVAEEAESGGSLLRLGAHRPAWHGAAARSGPRRDRVSFEVSTPQTRRAAINGLHRLERLAARVGATCCWR